MVDNGKVFEILMHVAVNNGLIVRFCPLTVSEGRLKGNRLALLQSMNIEDINYNLAHELAHAFLHYDKGDMLDMAIEKNREYEEQADRAAKMLLACVKEGAAVG